MSDLVVVLDGWLSPTGSPSLARTWAEFCAQVFASTPPANRGRWVMDLSCYRAIRSECGMVSGYPSPADMLFAVPVVVQDGGGLPHLE